MTEFLTLLRKELLRFWKVGFQTVCAPVLTALLYLMIFSQVLENHVQVHGIRYTAFLIPGLVMMSVLQNAFANSSSSLVQSKMMGNLVFLLLTPLTAWHWFLAYVLSSVVRGLAVGVGIGLVTAAVVVAVSELAKRSDKLGALLASLPLVTVLTLIWLYVEQQPEDADPLH